MSKFNPFDYFFILRPLILIPCWNFLLIGSFLARARTGFTKEIVLVLVIYTMLMGGVYILNQIMDLETDRINNKLFLLSGGYIPVKSAYLEMILLWIFAVLLSFRFGSVFLIFITVSLLIGILYSVPPIKLKGKPLLDTLANGIGYGLINFGIGWILFKEFQWSMFLKFLPYFLGICAVFINTTVVDIEGDKKARELTTAVFLKENISYLSSFVLISGATIISLIFKDLICFIPTVVALPLFFSCAFEYWKKGRVNRKLTIASFRLPGLIFTLITGFLYPPYFIALIILLVGMRVYYKKRLGIEYPTLASG